MNSTLTPDALLWITAYCAAFSRSCGQGIAHEKAADIARDEADAARKGADAFLGSL